jgi:superfamily II DNA helicase RecQ
MFDLKDEIMKGEYLFPNTIEEIDEFTGSEFENYLFFFFKYQGYKVRKTNDASDKGIDIIVTYSDDDGERKLGIQAKRWRQNVNSQEIRNMLDGKDEYNCDSLWLVTTSGVTRDANTTALNNEIIIKERQFVISTLESLKKMSNIKFRQSVSQINDKAQTDKPEVELSNSEKEIYDRLRRLRVSLANEKKVQLWLVYSNETIIDLIKKRPHNLEDLKSVKGLGHKRIDDFGNQLLTITKDID